MAEHCEDDVWRGLGRVPPGVWITPDGNWEILQPADPAFGDDYVSRNRCCCAFCKRLRHEADLKHNRRH